MSTNVLKYERNYSQSFMILDMHLLLRSSKDRTQMLRVEAECLIPHALHWTPI